jgi:hypothetical protein
MSASYSMKVNNGANHMADFETWMDAVKDQAGADYDDMASVYSFLEAYHDGMKPYEAIEDCLDWLEAE